jgi:hypothetical protein
MAAVQLRRRSFPVTTTFVTLSWYQNTDFFSPSNNADPSGWNREPNVSQKNVVSMEMAKTALSQTRAKGRRGRAPPNSILTHFNVTMPENGPALGSKVRVLRQVEANTGLDLPMARMELSQDSPVDKSN